MKHLSLLSLLIFAGLLCSAQQSLTFPYQALVRDATGNPVAHQEIKAKITLMADSLNRQMVFEEDHSKTTNGFGQLELQIGSENPEGFDTIPWNAGPMFIKLEVDLDGGTNYQEIGTHQLLAVPYAKYAEEAAGWKRNVNEISFNQGKTAIGREAHPSDGVMLTVGRQNESSYLAVQSDSSISSLLLTSKEYYWYLGMGNELFGEEPGSIGFKTSWSTTPSRMIITPSGKVGIGTIDPLAGLHVTKTIQYNGNNISAILGDGHMDWTYFGSITGGRIRGSHTGYIVIDGNPNGSGDNRVYINNECSSHVSIANGGGNVGVGYTTPSYRLHVNGIIKGNNVLYDFSKTPSIFNNPQQVISLSDLEELIKTEKQLPGQSQIIENDTIVDLAKMNAFLLNKIEELTIYTIQQQKEIEAQTQRFENLEAEIENLKSK